MPEVIQASEYENWASEIVCKQRDKYDRTEGCGAKLRITEKDFIPRYYMGTHFPHHYIAVQCPFCGKYVNAGKIPQPIIRRFWTPERKDAATFDGVRDVY